MPEDAQEDAPVPRVSQKKHHFANESFSGSPAYVLGIPESEAAVGPPAHGQVKVTRTGVWSEGLGASRHLVSGPQV